MPRRRRLAQLRERALADDTAMQLVTSLTTEVGPRLAGTPGDAAGVAWARAAATARLRERAHARSDRAALGRGEAAPRS
ncbi:MAG: hypothetical protein U1F11_07110 [Steroidobacteraceae bacterium]